MSNIFFSPVKINNRFKVNKKPNRPFSSIPSRSNFPKNNINNNTDIYSITDKRNLKYIIESNLYDNFSQNSTKITNTGNFYNKLRLCDLRGKEKYSNFTVFVKREMLQSEKKVKNKIPIRKIKREFSANQLNQNKIFREGSLYLTSIITKKPKRPISKHLTNFAPVYNRNKIDFTKKIYRSENNKNKMNIESKVIDNHKYTTINLLRNIEADSSIKEKSHDIEEEKNSYLFQKKLEYISINEKNNKALYNYMENLNNYIKNQYSNKLKAEKVRISNEEIKNENKYTNEKIASIKHTYDLYNDLFLNKFNDYTKFLFKKVDQNDKENYLLLNEVFVLQKEVNKLKVSITKLLEEKKIYNKFILLQISLKKKAINLPEHYDYILNHTLEEGIENYKGILDEKQVKEIYDYKNNIIYKNYDAFKHQFKAYENENRDLLKKLETTKREIISLNDDKNELIKEGKKLTNYFNNKIKEKSKERIDVMERYNLLISEKHNLLSKIRLSFYNFNNIKKRSAKRFSFIQDYNSVLEATNRGINKNEKNIYYKKINSKKNKKFNRNKNPKMTKNIFSPSKEKLYDDQLYINFNITYENRGKNISHSNLYSKVVKLFFLLKSYIEKDEYFKKEERIITENDLILKLLSKIENGMNLFLKDQRDFYEKNKEIVSKMKQKMEKQRKILKGQRYLSMLRDKYENMKLQIQEKAKKIYFLNRNKKRTVSANINKKARYKNIKDIAKKSDYELLIEYFKDN